MQVGMRVKQKVTTHYHLSFDGSPELDINCQRGFRSVMHRITVINQSWKRALRIRRALVRYSVDTKGARLCPWSIGKCDGNGNEDLTFEIPSIRQQYWCGDEKSVKVRACFDGTCPDAEFNVSYRVEVAFEREDGIRSEEVFEANMLVKECH